MKIYSIIAFCLILALLCIPASAQTISYTCPQGMGIYTLQMVGGSPTTATFELYRQDGTATSGSWSYLPYNLYGYPFANEASISLDGSSESQVFVTMGKLYVSLYPSRNLTEIAESRLIMGAGQTGAVNNIAVEKYGISSPIIGFKIIADSEITYSKTEDSLDTINANLNAPGVGDILDIAYETLASAINFIKGLIFGIKFFFVDNYQMILALFFAVPMAFAAKNSRGNPERFLRQYFKTLSGFFNFILTLWRMLLESIGTIRGWFRI